MVGHIVMALALLVIACCYAAVGLGGGSAYLAALSFYSSDPEVIRPLAWGLNIVVTLVAFNNYRRRGHFSAGLSWPFLAGGIAGAAAGARLPISHESFRFVLAISLILIALKMFHRSAPSESAGSQAKRLHWLVAAAIGAAIGVASGVVGIGGGIILGPVLLAFGFSKVKQVAALTTAYVFVTSLGALAAHLAGGGGIDHVRLVVFGGVCLAGGYLGSRYGAGTASPAKLQKFFAVLVLIAALRLLFF